MKMFMKLILLVLAFTWIPGAIADKGRGNFSPESIVTCQGGGPQMYMVIGMSLPAAIDAEQCIQPPDAFPRHCAPCVISLESQGCKIVEVVTGKSNEILNVTYLLSCAKP